MQDWNDPVLRFVARRLMISVGLLLGASFIMYQLVAISGDPLGELLVSTDPNRDQLIAERTALLNLDVPAPLRYFLWLAGAAKCLIPFADMCDLGSNVLGQPVVDMIPLALTNTLQLVIGATVLAILIGVLIGIVSALRHNTAFDYSLTFFVFLMFSLPSFFIAVLLKEFVGMAFNDFLAQPVLSIPALLIVAALVGAIAQTIVGGDRGKRVLVFTIAAAATAAVGVYIVASGWLAQPALGPVVILVAALAAGLFAAMLSTGLKNRPSLITAGIIAALAGVASVALQPLFAVASGATVLIVVVAFVAVGVGLGFALGGNDRVLVARIGGIAALVGILLVILDRFMAAWPAYVDHPMIRGRAIATIGSNTPSFQGDFWAHGIDTFTHYLLPTTAMLLVSMAAYTRYVRSGMLDVLKQDYIRTARAKGVSEPVVVMRHAFRNALIPLATYIPVDIAMVVGGAVITEQVFGIGGMGQLFVRSLLAVDPNPVMAYFLVVSTIVLIANLIADLSYAVLDPRIRVAS